MYKTEVNCLFLARSSVINFTEKVFTLVVVTELLEPQSQDSPVNDEEDSQKTGVVNTEPFTGTISGKSDGGKKGGRDESSKSSEDSLLDLWALHGHGERSSGLADAESYIMSKKKSVLVRYGFKETRRF
jgi:hypothetical protein